MRINSKSAFKRHAGKCVCANCHRKIHDGQIIVIKKHLGFGENLYVLEYIENGENKLLGLHY